MRTGWWVPTMTAMRHTPVIRTLAARLRAAGKPHTVIVIACQRNLLTIRNAMLAHDHLWSPRPCTLDVQHRCSGISATGEISQRRFDALLGAAVRCTC